MSPETLERLDQLRRDRRLATAIFLAKAFGAPVVLLGAVWWVTR